MESSHSKFTPELKPKFVSGGWTGVENIMFKILNTEKQIQMSCRFKEGLSTSSECDSSSASNLISNSSASHISIFSELK